ncbi:hypothetical protein G7Y89_g11448 [Cudoniella acicularis]|uniref:Uncharacterized protein n=1 Tax=Cudoniella acicularis TaxID=354080 RepID=A0A8H4RDH0_9HELO|nr:hypothetical protein G7Y89_g11448 [Cudoniella acicularis]
MLSPITPPPTPILEGARHLVVDYEPILTVNTPPQSLVLQITDRESYILVTNEVEVVYKAAAAHEVRVKYKAKVTHKAEQIYIVYRGREEDLMSASSKTPLRRFSLDVLSSKDIKDISGLGELSEPRNEDSEIRV